MKKNSLRIPSGDSSVYHDPITLAMVSHTCLLCSTRNRCGSWFAVTRWSGTPPPTGHFSTWEHDRADILSTPGLISSLFLADGVILGREPRQLCGRPLSVWKEHDLYGGTARRAAVRARGCAREGLREACRGEMLGDDWSTARSMRWWGVD